MNNTASAYPASVAQPFRDELTAVNFKELLLPADVDAVLDKKDGRVVLVVLNSVCGCAARSARPGAILSLLNVIVPDEYVTLFAGMEMEAVSHFRSNYLPELAASSPNIALFQNGKPLHILERNMIEGKTALEIAQELSAVYNTVCTRRNSAEEISKLESTLVSKYQVGI